MLMKNGIDISLKQKRMVIMYKSIKCTYMCILVVFPFFLRDNKIQAEQEILLQPKFLYSTRRWPCVICGKFIIAYYVIYMQDFSRLYYRRGFNEIR